MDEKDAKFSKAVLELQKASEDAKRAAITKGEAMLKADRANPPARLPVRSPLNLVLKPLQEDMQHVISLRQNAAILLILVGFVLGVLAARCICPRRIVVSNE